MSLAYRYALHRCVHDGNACPTPARRVLWVMLNPSTADDTNDDATIRKVKGFTKRWGFDELSVVNLFALRATDPALLWFSLLNGDEVVGERNDAVIAEECRKASMIVCAWGSLSGTPGKARAADVEQLLWRHRQPLTVLHMLRACRDGNPGHPLYVSYATVALPWLGLGGTP
jgi:hypothetical protein